MIIKIKKNMDGWNLLLFFLINLLVVTNLMWRYLKMSIHKFYSTV